MPLKFSDFGPIILKMCSILYYLYALVNADVNLVAKEVVSMAETHVANDFTKKMYADITSLLKSWFPWLKPMSPGPRMASLTAG